MWVPYQRNLNELLFMHAQLQMNSRGPGLPDGGIPSYQNFRFGNILEGLVTESDGMFLGQLVYFRQMFHSFFGYMLVYFPNFGTLYRGKSGNPGRGEFLGTESKNSLSGSGEIVRLINK
jgi:hypothetical protein